MKAHSGGTGDSVSLSEFGLRSTAPRRAVLEVLKRGGHLTAAAIFELVARDLPGTSLQAVYNVLAAFTEAGLVRRIELPGSSALYESRVGDNHHHLLCMDCGRVEDVPCVKGAAPCLAPSQTHGFSIMSAEVTFTGLCPDCRV
ncbi:MAG: Fur family transcriptional regulator [Arachnia sp.]